MSQTARSKTPARSVVILLFDGVQALDVTGPVDVLAQAELREPGSYSQRFVAAKPEIKTSSGLLLKADALASMDVSSIHTLLVPGGDAVAVASALRDAPMMRWLGSAVRAADRVASVCSGAFFLAQLGVLNNRRATTHWMGLELLSSSAPTAAVDADAMYTEDGHIWTSAGIAAGMDLALALVRRDLGPDAALAVARDLIIPVARTTGQLAYAEPMRWANQPANDLDSVLAYVAANIDKRLSVEDMAGAVGMSVRSFHRRCKQVYRITPAELLHRARLEKARVALLNSNAPLKEIAARVGYSSETALSHAFKRRFCMSPTDFRAGFSQPPQ